MLQGLALVSPPRCMMLLPVTPLPSQGPGPGSTVRGGLINRATYGEQRCDLMPTTLLSAFCRGMSLGIWHALVMTLQWLGSSILQTL
jgi:hypothetical protein